MALPFLKSPGTKGRDHLFSIDLGNRTTKAVYIQRKDDGFALARFAILDAPLFEKTWSTELLSEHLKNVTTALEPKTRQVSIAVGAGELVVRSVEMPSMPVHEMRQMLKINAKAYLQQDLPGYVYDCFIIPHKTDSKGPERSRSDANNSRVKVLVAGARQTLINDLQSAVKTAGLIPDFVVPALISPLNAFERAVPEQFRDDVVALVDIGFKNTTICLLQQGELILSRVVSIGGDRLTTGLSEMMGISYAEAEGIKIGMPAEVQSQLELLVSPLGRELRASIDFFEHQQDKTVSHVYLSGGSTRSEFIVQMLQNELAVECRIWNPASFLQLAMPAQQSNEIEQVASQLTVAIGAAVTAL